MEYTFKVKKKEFADTNKVSQLIREVKEEKAELAFTHKVNIKTTALHYKVLKDFRIKLNKSLKKINVNAELVETNDSNASNLYNVSYFDINLDRGGSFFVKICGISDNDRSISRYVTYTGNYRLVIKEGTYLETYSSARNKTIESIDDAIDFMSDNLKKHIAYNDKY
jgi:hypothetical protein